MPPFNKYDFIIAGAGCAGLSLAVALKKSKVKFNKVLIVDKDKKNTNDRTWCFWEKESDSWYLKLATKTWDSFHFLSENFSKEIKIYPYKYYYLNGLSFYNHCKNEISSDSRFEWIHEEIKTIETKDEVSFLHTNTNLYQANYIFNSAIRNQAVKANDVNLVQHFLGWFIKTPDNFFENKVPTFMDFRLNQKNDCRFMYVIPTSNNSALVEYTGFSQQALLKSEYETEIQSYIEHELKIKNYTITEKEYGEIPMAESKFINLFGKHVINIGTAGGYSKASTGYTFYFIQKNIKSLIRQLEAGSAPKINSQKKYQLYDAIFLKVLAQKKLSGDKLFATLFKNNSAKAILAFLNEESTFGQDLKLMNSVPKKIFVPVAIKEFF